MPKTFEVVVYADDGKGVTSAITEYDRDDEGHLTYVGRAWLDVDETAAVVAAVVAAVSGSARLTGVLSAARKCLGASVTYSPKELFTRLCALSDAFAEYDKLARPPAYSIVCRGTDVSD